MNDTSSRGLQVIRWNVIAFVPILVFAALTLSYLEIRHLPLTYSLIGGMILALLAIQSWLRDNLVFVAIIGAWAGLSIGAPMLLFAHSDVPPAVELLTFWLWVMTGASTVFFVFRRQCEAHLKRNR